MIEELAVDAGFELVEVELFRAGRREVLRIFLDREGGISLENCEHFSRLLSARFDTEDAFPDAYTLEVSSPGLDRPLRTLPDWRRRKGEWVQARLREPVEGKASWVGRLVGVEEDAAVLQLEGSEQTIRIPYASVALARVDVRMND